MRCLRIAMYTHKRATLPIAYNQLVQGMLYSCWRESHPEVHGTAGERHVSRFTFGPIEGGVTPDSRSKTVQLQGTASIEVRSPSEELIDELATKLASRGTVRIGAHELELVNLESRDRLIFPERSLVCMRAPVVAYRTVDEYGHTQPFSPADPEWHEIVAANAEQKLWELGLEPQRELQIVPMDRTLHKCVTRFKGTYITGWKGDLIVSADSQTMATLWCLGLGSKNSDGFGMFDIIEKPL